MAKTRAQVLAEQASAQTVAERAQADADAAELGATFPDEAAAAKALADEEQAQRVADAAQKVADAKVVLGQAQSDHDAAVAEHKSVSEAPAVEVVYGQHVLVDLGGSGVFTPVDVPMVRVADGVSSVPHRDWVDDRGVFRHPRQFLIAGRNVEHVSEHPSGAWQYRAM